LFFFFGQRVGEEWERKKERRERESLWGENNLSHLLSSSMPHIYIYMYVCNNKSVCVCVCVCVSDVRVVMDGNYRSRARYWVLIPLLLVHA